MIEPQKQRSMPAVRQTGLTLPDVLIALLILSIGLLGLAMLQATALRSSQTAQRLYVTTSLAIDIAERMQSNPAGTARGEYNVSPGQIPSSTGADLGNWLARLNEYPNIRASITPCSSTGASACPDVSSHLVTLYSSAGKHVGQLDCRQDQHCYQSLVSAPQ